MMDKVNKDIVSFLMKANLPSQDSSQVKREQYQKEKLQTSRAGMGAPVAPNQATPHRKSQPVRVERKVGRNEPCPCGSGKKFKQCHGK